MTRRVPESARILVIDDEDASVRLLQRILRSGGYGDVQGVTDPRLAEAAFDTFVPDLVLLDLRMPHLEGLELLDRLSRRVPSGEFLPILVLTADLAREARQQCLAKGAKDFLTKPFDANEVLLRIHNLLETRMLYLELEDYNKSLETQIRVRTWELEDARNEVIERLAVAAEYRDDGIGEHIQRVGKMSADLAIALAFPVAEVELIGRSAPLHDVGKIGVPDHILSKPGKLTVEEFEQVKVHSRIGAEILSGDHFPLLRMAGRIALTHHERWDGSGYPQALAGEAIPIEGRIVAVADVFDALRSERPYKSAWSIEESVAEIQAQRGRQFDPDVVDAFLSISDTLILTDQRGA